jgi:hypothetical protein
MILEPIIPTHDQIEVLYAQLEGRRHNISHQFMPSFKDHISFVRNHPYRDWMIVKNEGRAIGNVYIHFDNSIGFHLGCSENVEHVSEILKQINRSYSPLPAVPSVRIGDFFLRVASDNHGLQETLSKLDFREVERTFVPQRGEQKF